MSLTACPPPNVQVKPSERNTRYVDAVMTVPKGTLFPMCGMNLAFNRDLIGPAMYFGLMGDGQPIGRYDDMWAGWCCKVRGNAAAWTLFAVFAWIGMIDSANGALQ